MKPDPYSVLGVRPGASSDEVRRAYLQKAKLVHPDRSKAPDALQAFQQLQEAYQAIAGGAASSSSAGGASGAAAGTHARAQSAAEQWTWQEGQRARGPPFHEWDPYHHSRPRPPPTPTFWELVQQRRIWQRGGLVHRSFHSLVFNIVAAWPLWIFVGGCVAMLGGPRRAPEVQYDRDGKAFVIDRHGHIYRIPQYDRIE